MVSYSGAGVQGEEETVEEKRILLVEDDYEIASVIRYYLVEHGFCVTTAADMSEIRMEEIEGFQAFLLDIMLPDSDGIALCRMLRERTDAPILFISAKDDSATIIRALNMGGDDYLVKPFDEAVLLARLDANLRRRQASNAQRTSMKADMTAGELRLSVQEPILYKGERRILLSPIEHQIMMLMFQHAGETLSMEQIYQCIWDRPSLHDYRTITVHVSNLRKKLEEEPANPKYIRTVWKIGYVFQRSGKQKEPLMDQRLLCMGNGYRVEAISPTRRPEVTAQLMALPVRVSSPWRPPTTSPAAYRLGIGCSFSSHTARLSLTYTPPSVVAKRSFCSTT